MLPFVQQLLYCDAMVDYSISISLEPVSIISLSWVDMLILYVLLFGVVLSGMMRLCDGSNKGTVTMQPSCPGLSLATRVGCTVMTSRVINTGDKILM
jgi:hypothetical protein